MSPTQEPTPPDNNRHEDDVERGRSRNQAKGRAGPNINELGDGLQDDGDDNLEGSSNGEDGPARKRRRSRKGLDKKFECPHDGCGKSYSRAEHL